MADTVEIEHLVEATQRIINCVSFDVNGIALPTGFQGGNGGLTSNDTIKACDAARVLISRWKAQQKAPDA